MGCCCAVIDQSTVGIVESWGKYDRIIQPGFHCLNCFAERIHSRPSLRLDTINIKIETVTKESLSVTIMVGIQYKINDENIENIESQMILLAYFAFHHHPH